MQTFKRKSGRDHHYRDTLEVYRSIHFHLVAVFQLLRPLVQAIQPWLVPFCFFFAWTIVGLMGWSLWTAMHDTIAQGRQMHRIPCAGCQFFTGDYHLKCTVRPSIALTEEAISCSDYEPCAGVYSTHQQTLS